MTFSHEKHKAKGDKCTSCHVKVFKMKKGTTGPLTMEKMKAGEQCGACHNGKTEVGGQDRVRGRRHGQLREVSQEVI